MLWGSYSLVHIITLLLSAAIIVGLYFILRKCSDKVKTIVLFVLSFSGISAIIFNLVTWGSPIEYLPFHMCSISAMLLPFAVITRNKVINNLLLLWCLGALIALVLNQAQANYEIFSWRRITLAPILIVGGFAFEIYALMKRFDKPEEEK